MSIRPTLLVAGGAGFIGVAVAPALVERFDWSPRFSLHEGIDRLASWIDAQPDVEPA